MKNLYSIGEVSKLKDITIKALRYYQKVGILEPKYVDKETGYRYYSIDQFVHIDIIKTCRALGTSINELQQIFRECNTDELLEFLRLRRIEAEDNIRKMKEIINNIDNLNKTVEISKHILNNKKISVQYFRPRLIAIEPCKEAGSLKELIYYSYLDKSIHEKGMKTSMERGIIYELSKDNKIKPKYVFNGIEEVEGVREDKNIEILPSGNYVTIIYNKENEEEQRNTVINYIKANNLKIKKYMELEVFNDLFNTEAYSCQIQILIEEREK